jgi:hypothetical protein
MSHEHPLFSIKSTFNDLLVQLLQLIRDLNTNDTTQHSRDESSEKYEAMWLLYGILSEVN